MKSWPSLLLLTLMPALLFAQAQSPTPQPGSSPEKKAKPKATPKPAMDEDERVSQMLATMPANQVFQNVSIPSLGPNGQIQSLFKAESVKRVGDRDMEMKNLQIQIHNDDGTTFHVQMAHSIFNFDTKILTSDTPTTIKRDDFVINGDRAEFNVKTRFGRMLGNVKMVIDSGDSNEPAKPKRPRPRPADAAKAATKATPSPTPNPNAQ